MNINNVLFLTGCNGQIGSAICKSFKRENWLVYGLDLGPESQSSAFDCYISGSVTKRESFRMLFSKSVNLLSEESKICLINNAGLAVFTPSEERTYEEFLSVSEVNLLGPIYGMTEFFRFCKSQALEGLKINNAQIINISSVYGLISPNKSIYTDTARSSSEIYGATKAGLAQMTKYFASRYGEDGVRVNCIAPGGVLNEDLQGPAFLRNYSELVPMKRLCKDNEVAELILSLVSGNFSYVTGQTIPIDGGMTSW